MPGFLTPALCFGGGALLGVGLFVALNWEPIRDRIGEAVEEQRVYWDAIQAVRAKRQEEARRAKEDAEKDSADELEKRATLYRTSSPVPEYESDADTSIRHRATVKSSRRESFTMPAPSFSESSETTGSSPSSLDATTAEAFAVYTIVPSSSSEDEDELSETSENEFSSYDKFDSEMSC